MKNYPAQKAIKINLLIRRVILPGTRKLLHELAAMNQCLVYLPRRDDPVKILPLAYNH
jgi:hypothetical protein